MQAPVLRLDEVGFAFGARVIFDRATCFFAAGERVGVVGRNGAGKTTLFHLLLGELEPDSGAVRRSPSATVAYLPQHPRLPAEDSVLHHVLDSHPTVWRVEEEILRVEREMAAEHDPARIDRLVERHRRLGEEFRVQGGYEIEGRVERALRGLGFRREDLLRRIGEFSPGERNRIALAKVLIAEPSVLILDEPTNHLDMDCVEWLEEFLCECGKTVIVASHDRYFLNRVAQHVYELRGDGIHPYPGNYDAFVVQRSEEMERVERVWERQQEELQRQEEFIRRNFAAQKARQASSRRKAIARTKLVEAPQGGSRQPSITFRDTPRGGDHVLRATHLDCGYGGVPVVRGVNLELRRGERLAVLGPNGCGKTTLLKSLVGELPPLSGEIKRGPRTTVGYYRQELGHLEVRKSVFDYVHDLVPTWARQQVLELLAAFLFRGEDVQVECSALSGGERAKVALIELILAGTNLLVLDEPTNHLDVFSREALESALDGFAGTVIFVSHDRYFVESIADRVLLVEDGRAREMGGGLAEYEEGRRRRALEAQAPAAPVVRSRRSASGKAASARKASEEERLLAKICAIEDSIAQREADAGLEENYRSPEAMRRLKAEIEVLRADRDRLYTLWDGGGAQVTE